jgi:aminoglycoside phosphotransferase family enzyme
VELNRRLAPEVYIDVLPVRKINFSFQFGGEDGVIVDYAVRMKKLDNDRQMDTLLSKNKVTTHNIRALASTIANFHKTTKIVSESAVFSIQNKFNDLQKQKDFLKKKLGADCDFWITDAISASDEFLSNNKDMLDERLQAGFLRDCHGDLHTRNIFLLPEPVVFDCIEFNDEYREIDVLNEVAFLCMDLDAFDGQDLSDFFIQTYNEFFPSIRNEADRKLFIYYKCYRANIRAKVNSLRAESATNEELQKQSLSEAYRYLHLMNSYVPLFF